MRRSKDLWFLGELAAAAVILALLLLLAIVANARASGVVNMLLGAGGNGPYNISASLTAGSNVVSGTGDVGYISGSIGSFSPTALSGNNAVYQLNDVLSSSTVIDAQLEISGFSSEPNQGWLGNVTCNGETYNGTNASSFTYTSGTADWVWGTSTAWALTNGSNYSCTVVYNVPFYSSSLSVTAGSNVVSGNGDIGYISGSIGSISGAALPGGYTIIWAVDTESGGTVTSATVEVDGFSSDPGKGWLGTVTFNGATLYASAANETYGSGTATWTWSTSSGWGFVDSDTYPGVVTSQ